MESLYSIVEMARMNKSQIQNGGDELRYQADRMAAKARKLRRAGKEKEAMEALAEAAKLREQAANWKPEVEFEEKTVCVYKLGWHSCSFWSGIGSDHWQDPDCTRGLLADNLDFIKQNTSKEERKKFLVINRDGSVWPTETDDSPLTYENGLLLLMNAASRNKSTGQVLYNMVKAGEMQIEVRKDDNTLWRPKGEKEWRRMPSKSDWGI